MTMQVLSFTMAFIDFQEIFWHCLTTYGGKAEGRGQKAEGINS
ncbi:MAG: hypothetical protein QNJ38_13075 [Prochloraceae cyanobacterium]|nr:hypothetical protein [Prochloraceae cyanobacterium]